MAGSLLGLLSAVLALAVPFLPVKHDITTLRWPTAAGTAGVNAPLVTFSPLWIDATVPCRAAQELDARSAGPGVLFTTNAPKSQYGAYTAMTLQVDQGQLTLFSSGRQLGSRPLPEGDCSITVHSDAAQTVARVGTQTIAFAGGDQRPQLTGIYSDLNAKVDNVHGVLFQARVDNRFESSPTTLKIAVSVLAVLAFVGSIITVRQLDVRAGRRPPRLVPPGWWKPTGRDAAVVSALLMWWAIGAMTSDDGYVLSMLRSRASAGYVSNYYRWFANPESPFGWFYEIYAAWAQISTTTPWVRLPALAIGIVSWLLISREVLPRLGQQVRRSNAAGWGAAAVFLAFWLPYNNGLRSEPVVVLFSLLTLCAVERAVATRRLMPAALGLVGASLSVAASPHGLLAVLPYLAALKPLLRMVRQRAREFGWLPVLAPLAASGFLILTVIFVEQTWQSTVDATELKSDVGPSEDWYQEFLRYSALFSESPDGSLVRRFPVLLVILCLATCAVMLLRRGQIRGAALGPSRRLLAVAALSFVVLALTPTKWTHHFGILAAFGGAVAALTALATSSTVLRSRRNRSVFFAGLMLILAFSCTGPNAWWYVSGWGVPWSDRPPTLGGYRLSTVFLLVTAIALIVAFVEHMRIDEHNPQVVGDRARGEEQRSRALRLGTAPLSIICAMLVIFELASFAKVLQKQWGTYSLGVDNLRQIVGSSCGLSDYIYVETNPQAGMLRVAPDQPNEPAPDTEVPDRLAGEEDAAKYLRAKMVGFSRPGLPPGTGRAPQEPDWTPPHRFGGDNAPVWGSYDQFGLSTGELRTQWYELPERATTGKVPVVVSLAGADAGANSVIAEFGRKTDRGFEIMDRRPIGEGRGAGWHDSRVTVGGLAEGATMMRIVATDQALGPNGWVAVSAPRAPQLTNMTDFVGDTPTFVEWPAALVHPCLDLDSFHNGIAELPRFRVSAGGGMRGVGQGWSSPEAGGPFGWLNVTASMRELPTYLTNNINRDWGSLYAVDPYEPDALPAEAAMQVHTETRWGTWSPGPLSKAVRLPGAVPKSDNRTDVRDLGSSADDDK